MRTELDLPAAAAGPTPEVACRPPASIAANEVSNWLHMEYSTADISTEQTETVHKSHYEENRPIPQQAVWLADSDPLILVK